MLSRLRNGHGVFEVDARIAALPILSSLYNYSALALLTMIGFIVMVVMVDVFDC
jgi:hypothetical protein